jgi:hypothetical protein
MRSLHKVTCPSVRPHASYLNVILVVVWAGGGITLEEFDFDSFRCILYEHHIEPN